jgi:outer membrane receptor protein involved in Fe transport
MKAMRQCLPLLRAAPGDTRRSIAAKGHARTKLSLEVAAALYGVAVVNGVPGLAASTGASDVLQEITVTARKRTENLQDVPQSIDVFTAQGLQNLGISQGLSIQVSGS